MNNLARKLVQFFNHSTDHPRLVSIDTADLVGVVDMGLIVNRATSPVQSI